MISATIQPNTERMLTTSYPHHPIEDLPSELGLPFHDLSLLAQAMTHRSYYNEQKKRQRGLRNNERLEFLGDAVLELVAAEWLFQQFPQHFEGQLTMLRMRLTRTESLADYALSCGLDRYVRLAKGDENQGARASQRVLGNAFEALLGALYLDQGLEAARPFILSFLGPNLQKVLAAESVQDSKSRFQEWSQAQSVNITPTYQVLASDMEGARFLVEVRQGETPVAWGNGATVRAAEQQAAQFALAWLATDELLE
jgi:ribonuclease-3